MTRKPLVAFLGMSVLAAASPLLAEDGFPQSFEVTNTKRVKFAPGGLIRVNGSYGYLVVEGWDEPQVEVTITKSTDQFYKPGRQAEAKRRLELIQVVTERRSDTEVSISTNRAPRSGMLSLPLLSTTKAGVTVDYQIHVPRQSRLAIHHDTGYVWVGGVTGEIEATSRTGDMIVMLPAESAYTIEAKSRLGSITSDFAGVSLGQFVVGSRFAHTGEGPSRRIFLRTGVGSITVKRVPPPWSPKEN